MNPYPFQHKILDLTRQSYRDNYGSPLVVSPTGSGKTIMFAYIALSAMKKGKRVLIIVHRNEILEQTLKKLFEMGVQAGQIASGKPLTRDKIQVAMVGTIVNRLDRIKKPDLIIVDEAHHAVAPTWRKILSYFQGVPVAGFTATPELLSGAGLGLASGGIFDCMVKGPSVNWLVDNGYLAYPFMCSPGKLKKYHIKRGDFDKDEQEQEMTKKSIVGDAIAHYKQHLDGLPTIVSCVSIKHCYMMAEQYSKYAAETGKSWKAVVVQGGSKYKKERVEGIQGLGNGSVQQVMFCDVITEGVDVPVLMGVQNLRQTQSLALILQIWGRALRAVYADGYDLSTVEGRLQAIANSIKPNAVILDHAGNYHLHGHVLNERSWSLEALTRAKRKEKPPTTTKCPKCKGIWPGEPRKCPQCGHLFTKTEMSDGRKTPEIIEGELRHVLPEGIDGDKIQDMVNDIQLIQKMNPKTRQKFMLKKAYELNDKKEIAALAAAVGYKQGWTRHVWTEILGNRW